MGGGMKFSGVEVAQNLFRDCFAQNIHLHFARLVDAGKIHFIRSVETETRIIIIIEYDPDNQTLSDQR